MIDEYLDCTGKKRLFRLSLYALGNFLEAVELRDGEPIGWRFVLPVEPDRIPPWGEMRDRIREHLARRDIVRDSDGRLQLLHRRIRAQISEIDEATEPKLALLVDDLDELLGHVAAAANHAERPKMQKDLDQLYERLAAILEAYSDEGA